MHICIYVTLHGGGSLSEWFSEWPSFVESNTYIYLHVEAWAMTINICKRRFALVRLSFFLVWFDSKLLRQHGRSASFDFKTLQQSSQPIFYAGALERRPICQNRVPSINSNGWSSSKNTGNQANYQNGAISKFVAKSVFWRWSENDSVDSQP